MKISRAIRVKMARKISRISCAVVGKFPGKNPGITLERICTEIPDGIPRKIRKCIPG